MNHYFTQHRSLQCFKESFFILPEGKGIFMTYVQFIEAIEKKIKKEVTEEKRVSIHTNMKNNGVKKKRNHDHRRRNQYITDDLSGGVL